MECNQIQGRGQEMKHKEQVNKGMNEWYIDTLADSMYNLHLDLKIPKFEESINPVEFINNIETYLKLTNTSDERKCIIIEYLIDGRVKQWFDIHRDNISNFHEFRVQFLEEFWSIPKQIIYRNKWLNRKYDPSIESLTTYFYRQLYEAKFFNPVWSEYEVNYTIVQQFPYDIRMSLVTLNYEDTYAIKRTLEQIEYIYNDYQQDYYNYDHHEGELHQDNSHLYEDYSRSAHMHCNKNSDYWGDGGYESYQIDQDNKSKNNNSQLVQDTFLRNSFMCTNQIQLTNNLDDSVGDHVNTVSRDELGNCRNGSEIITDREDGSVKYPKIMVDNDPGTEIREINDDTSGFIQDNLVKLEIDTDMGDSKVAFYRISHISEANDEVVKDNNINFVNLDENMDDKLKHDLIEKESDNNMGWDIEKGNYYDLFNFIYYGIDDVVCERDMSVIGGFSFSHLPQIVKIHEFIAMVYDLFKLYFCLLLMFIFCNSVFEFVEKGLWFLVFVSAQFYHAKMTVSNDKNCRTAKAKKHGNITPNQNIRKDFIYSKNKFLRYHNDMSTEGSHVNGKTFLDHPYFQFLCWKFKLWRVLSRELRFIAVFLNQVYFIKLIINLPHYFVGSCKFLKVLAYDLINFTVRYFGLKYLYKCVNCVMRLSLLKLKDLKGISEFGSMQNAHCSLNVIHSMLWSFELF